jgi:hypothetical protein
VAPGFKLDGLHHKAHGVDVFDFAARPQFGGANRANRDVSIAAHAAFFHVAVACSQIAQDGTQFPQVRTGLIRAAHVGLRDNLHQRHTRAIQINE